MPEDTDQTEPDKLEQLSWARLTTEIVSAFVANNRITPGDLAELIGAVAESLTELNQEQNTAAVRPEPIVSVRRSIGRDYLTCLICGKRQRLLKRHLASAHNLTPLQYRETFGLSPDYPMVAPSYAELRAELALRTGLGKPSRAKAKRTLRARIGGDPTTKP